MAVEIRSKSSTSQHQNERRSDNLKLENASDLRGLVHSTEEVDEVVSSQGDGSQIKCKTSDRSKVGSCRKRFACGPRSRSINLNSRVVGWDEHRVVSTELQGRAGGAEEVEVVMKVTLLAAGFVIGVRGATVSEIEQATRAFIHSWTETDCAHSAALPVRLFCIRGNKIAVWDAVYVIQEAVAKYRALCECKSRGEFVERQHVINGVEFFYQPPPKIALPPLENNVQSPNFTRNHVWSMPQMHSPAFGCNCVGQFKHHDCCKPKDAAVYNRNSVSPDKSRGASNIGYTYSWPGLFHCQGFGQEGLEEEIPKSMNTDLGKISTEKVLCVEEKLGDLDMEDEEEKRSVDPWSGLAEEREKQEQMNCSLFSYFGPEGLPLPISPFSYTSPFDFPSCEFSGGRSPSFSFASPLNCKPLGIAEKEKSNNIDERL